MKKDNPDNPSHFTSKDGLTGDWKMQLPLVSFKWSDNIFIKESLNQSRKTAMVKIGGGWDGRIAVPLNKLLLSCRQTCVVFNILGWTFPEKLLLKEDINWVLSTNYSIFFSALEVPLSFGKNVTKEDRRTWQNYEKCGSRNVFVLT